MDKEYIGSMLKYAEQDLKALPHLLSVELYNLVVYHSQQCIEKSLKVILNYKENRYITHHDTKNLCESAGKNFEFFESYIDISAELRGSYILTHYPEINNKFVSYSRENAVTYMDAAASIYGYTLDIINNNK